MNSFNMVGKFYGQLKTNVDLSNPDASGDKVWANFTVGVYNGYKKNVEFFPCVAFGGTAVRVAKNHADKVWVGISGSVRHDKREHEGKTYNDIKLQVWSVTVPHPPDNPAASAPPPQQQRAETYGDDDDPPF